jgi:hypothetical protein
VFDLSPSYKAPKKTSVVHLHEIIWNFSWKRVQVCDPVWRGRKSPPLVTLILYVEDLVGYWHAVSIAGVSGAETSSDRCTLLQYGWYFCRTRVAIFVTIKVHSFVWLQWNESIQSFSFQIPVAYIAFKCWSGKLDASSKQFTQPPNGIWLWWRQSRNLTQ